jgi:hypothetical protein
MMRKIGFSAIAAIAAVSGCDSIAPPPASTVDGAPPVTISEESKPEVAVGATGIPIDSAAKTVVVVSAPGVLSASAAQRVANLEAQQRGTQARLEQFVGEYQQSLDDPAARERLVESRAADFETYKSQSLELYKAQRALAGK